MVVKSLFFKDVLLKSQLLEYKFRIYFCYNKMARTLGHVLNFKNRSADYLVGQKQTILSAIKEHGAICIPNADFKPKDMLHFTEGIFDYIYALPKKMAFMNVDNNISKVTRVGNILPDGSVKDSSKQATYWHSDGNFLGEKGRGLFNVLHSVEKPEIGGDTHLIDLVKAANFIKNTRPKIYDALLNATGVTNFDDIPDFFLYGDPGFQGQKVTRHSLIKKHEFNQKQIIYLAVDKFEDNTTKKIIEEFNGYDIMKYVEEKMGYYVHKWNLGDIVMWDNVQTLHRSAGAFKGRRLMYKCHGYFK